MTARKKSKRQRQRRTLREQSGSDKVDTGEAKKDEKKVEASAQKKRSKEVEEHDSRESTGRKRASESRNRRGCEAKAVGKGFRDV